MTSAIQSSVERLAQTRRYHGALASVKWFGSRFLDRLLHIEVAELLWLESSQMRDSGFLDSKFSFRKLTAAELADFSADPFFELEADFVRQAENSDDLCFGVLHGDRLASYSWYAPGSIAGEHNLGVPMSYPDDVAYMYKAFTHPDYRGRRLYGLGIELALRALGSRGITKLVTTVHANNFASLASCRRMGFKRIGRLWTVSRGGDRWAIRPRAARQFGIRFTSEPASAVSAGSSTRPGR